MLVEEAIEVGAVGERDHLAGLARVVIAEVVE